MLTLVVDTSTPAVTAGLADVGETVKLLAEERVVNARAHGEQLTPLISAVLGAAGVAPGDLTAVVAGTGPGPFTGLRVGLVTAAALSHALSIPAYGVCSLDGIGHAVTGEPGRVLVATDARRKEVYWAVYADGRRDGEPAVGRPAELPVPADVVAAVGDGGWLYADVLPLPLRESPRYPRPETLAELAADRVRDGAPGETLTPLYLRRPDVHLNGQRQRA